MKIALIDPIGKKMGMNHYDDGLMNALADKGLTTFVLSNYKSAAKNVHSKIFFKNVDKPRLISVWGTFSGLIISVFFCRLQKMDWIIFHVFRGGPFDVFILLLSKILKLKIFLIVHDIETIDTSTYKFIKRIVLSSFHNAMVVHNQYSMEKIKEFTGKPDLKNLHIIPHGNYAHIAHPVYTREQALNHFKLDPSQHYLLFFGQIKKTKGLDVLLEAMHYSKSNFKLIIAGKLRIKNFSPYQKIIERHGLEKKVITMLRFITDEEADKLFSLCDAVVLPYRNIYQSGVLLLSMSLGKTVIASDLEPFKEIIQHEVNGLLFEKNSPQSLAEIIDEVFSGKLNINLIQQQAKHTAEKGFSWNEIGETFAGLLS
ncbi:MAG TPA: glycosyltransferase [Bacteroidia bacterium]|nr:glycosyltransferase [Bacteroidia bacterium]